MLRFLNHMLLGVVHIGETRTKFWSDLKKKRFLKLWKFLNWNQNPDDFHNMIEGEEDTKSTQNAKFSSTFIPQGYNHTDFILNSFTWELKTVVNQIYNKNKI